jgi:hypothetical protein
MKNSIQLFQKYTLKLLLIMIAIYSGLKTLEFGESYGSETGNSLYLDDDGEYREKKSADNVAIDVGYDGGAIGFGLICSVSIFCFVWISQEKPNA